MNFTVFFMTHKALRKQNKQMRERISMQEKLLRENCYSYGAGFRAALELWRREEKLLHEEIAHLNDLLVAK